MTLYSAKLDTPIGMLTVVGTASALTGVYMEDHKRQPDLNTQDGRDMPVIAEALAQLRQYFAGERVDFDLPLAAKGTDFQKSVWAELCQIPLGETRAYGDIARRLGNDKAMRAVGAANGRNPISVIVPCHRVVGANGKLVGYAGGLTRKKWLLAHEAKMVQGQAGSI